MKIVQCWDDGNVDDIRLISLLRKYNARASFNLAPGLHRSERYLSWKYEGNKEVWRLALPEFRDVYKGFPISSHSLTHPHLEELPENEVRREVFDAKDCLEQIFSSAIIGFAYPFGTYNEMVQSIVHEAGHHYARTTGSTTKAWPVSNAMEFHPSCFHLDSDFWQIYEQVKVDNGVFYFWGHSYEFVTEADWQSFEAKIARMADDPAVEWADLPDLFTK